MITGFSDALVRSCVSQAQRKGFDVVVALPVTASLAEFTDPAVTAITWTPRSAISAKSLILKVTNRVQSLDEAVVIVEIPPTSRAFHEASYSDLDEMIDTYVKGPVFLVREILGLFVEGGRGGLTVVLRTYGYETSPMARALQSALESLFETILVLYQKESVTLRAFLVGDEDDGEIARAVLDDVAVQDGKAHKKFRRLGGRPGIFAGRR